MYCSKADTDSVSCSAHLSVSPSLTRPVLVVNGDIARVGLRFREREREREREDEDAETRTLTVAAVSPASRPIHACPRPRLHELTACESGGGSGWETDCS